MAVYTHIESSDVQALVTQYDLGDLVSLTPISAGIENSNYVVQTTGGKYVLTLFEHHAPDEVREFVRLARHLSDAGLPVPSPLSDHQGQWLQSLRNRPAILCVCFDGQHPQQLNKAHCAAIGLALARFHLESASLPNRRCDERGFDWWVNIAPELSADLGSDDKTLLMDEINHQRAHRSDWLSLPHGWIHADLFHDNALFAEDAELSAILDLYNACDGAWLYDLAIVANDWCANPDGSLDANRVAALLAAYQSVRPLTDAEQRCWNLVLRGGALRFWLSRLLAARLATRQQRTLPENKQPEEYKRRLIFHRNTDISFI